MARNRASMREGPLAELFRATEAAQARQSGRRGRAAAAADGARARDARSTGRRPSRRRSASPSRRGSAREPEPTELPEPAAVRPPRAGSTRFPSHPARLERARDSTSYLAVIRVVGVGGAGLNAVDRMIDAGITQVDFVAVNTDIQQLQMCDAPTKIHIGSELTEGLGSGADPEIGRHAAEDGYD